MYLIADGRPFCPSVDVVRIVSLYRCVSIFPDQLGFAVGSIEGRVGIEYFAEQAGKQAGGTFKPVGSTYGKQSFAFKCHRVTVGFPVDWRRHLGGRWAGGRSRRWTTLVSRQYVVGFFGQPRDCYPQESKEGESKEGETGACGSKKLEPWVGAMGQHQRLVDVCCVIASNHVATRLFRLAWILLTTKGLGCRTNYRLHGGESGLFPHGVLRCRCSLCCAPVHVEAPPPPRATRLRFSTIPVACRRPALLSLVSVFILHRGSYWV